MNRKISFTEYYTTLNEYDGMLSECQQNGTITFIRLGQMFCNKFSWTWPEIFYERDKSVVKRIIIQKMIRIE